jgi:hypothetical protein
MSPNIRVSLVMLPDECRGLQDDPHRFWAKELKMRALRTAFAFQLRRELKRAGNGVSVASPAQT